MTRTLVILQKELHDLMRNWGLLIALAVPAAMIPTLALVSLYVTGLAPETIKLPPNIAVPAHLKGASGPEIAQFAALAPFFLIWLVFPVTIPSVIAANAIVGEKEAGTLEPLLATPIRTWELLLGKALSSVLPALLLTWLPFLALVIGAQRLTTPTVLSATVFSGPWLLGIFGLAPSLTLLTVMFLVIVSAWVTEVRTANQLGAVLVAPLVAMIVVQLTKGMVITMATVLSIWTVVILLLLITLPIAVRLFRRETILIRWKQAGS